MANPSLQLPPSFTGEVRLFPLPDLVFFPHNVLPLHIFESRYREMLEDALQDDRLIAIATLLPGYDHEYYSRPPVAPVVCVGRVTDHEKTDKGTYNLVLVGLQRAEIQHEIEPVRSFRRARVRLIDHVGPEGTEPSKEGEDHLFQQIRQKLPSADKLIAEFTKRRISFTTLIDVLAFHMPLDVDLKLKLLSEADVLARAKLLLASIPPVESEPNGGRRFPTGFSDN